MCITCHSVDLFILISCSKIIDTQLECLDSTNNLHKHKLIKRVAMYYPVPCVLQHKMLHGHLCDTQHQDISRHFRCAHDIIGYFKLRAEVLFTLGSSSKVVTSWNMMPSFGKSGMVRIESDMY